MHGWSFLCMAGHSCAWAFVFMCGRPFLCVGDRLCAWATVFVHGGHFCAWWSFLCMSGCFCAWVVVSVRGWSFPCMGGQLDAWVVVGVGGVVVACGVVVLWFSWDHSGRVGGAYRVEEQRRTMNIHCELCLHAEVVVAVWSAHWRAWCLALDGEGRRRRATHVDDGGYVERLWD